jgi:hypothetical protein
MPTMANAGGLRAADCFHFLLVKEAAKFIDNRGNAK